MTPNGRPLPMSILLVDDHRDGGDSCAELLRLLGYEVRLARSGADALTVAGTFAPDVAILDIGLPDMDGYHLAEKLVAVLARRPLLVALTGYGNGEERARAAGFDHYLLKPVEPERLARVLVARVDHPDSTTCEAGGMGNISPQMSGYEHILDKLNPSTAKRCPSPGPEPAI